MNPPFLQSISLSAEETIPATAFLIGRIPELHLPNDRQAALELQRPLHQKIVEKLFFASGKSFPLVYSDQIHGDAIGIVAPPFENTNEIKQVDGLITAHSGVILGITIADCAPVWIVEKQGRAGGLIHSGKKGTELGIVPKAIARFQKEFQIAPSELSVTIGPCIRPPCYEIDFAKTIREQAAAAGVLSIQDEECCTACHLDRYYSYRREQGKTGHMLALLLLRGLAKDVAEFE